MKVLITGEAGFIARNLSLAFSSQGHEVLSIKDSNVLRLQSTGETCVHRNTPKVWEWHLKNLDVDLVVHNAAVVGTDVVALNPNEATLSNVVGSYNIAMACKNANIPVCYMGTTVIYDTAKYQSDQILEDSAIKPMTFYGSQKLAGEHVVTSHAKDWLVIRPLFAYGGVGDMNSLIAKSVYAHLNNESDLDMFLDPGKIKDYLHVQDFCEAVVLGCSRGLWGNDYNISAETPHVTLKIVEMMNEVLGADISTMIKWHADTDYLGNHMLSSAKFRNETGWSPKITLKQGIDKVYKSILESDDSYDPLVHLNKARQEGIDLTEFYNSNI
tara:strand:- start:5540 stop:6520 length:981 start_codon:yes stop_codon:yes gene_type:complete